MGKCPVKDCKLLHRVSDFSNKELVDCYFWMNGSCKYSAIECNKGRHVAEKLGANKRKDSFLGQGMAGRVSASQQGPGPFQFGMGGNMLPGMGGQGTIGQKKQLGLGGQQLVFMGQQPGMGVEQPVMVGQQPVMVGQLPGMGVQQPGMVGHQLGRGGQQFGMMGLQTGLVGTEMGQQRVMVMQQQFKGDEKQLGLGAQHQGGLVRNQPLVMGNFQQVGLGHQFRQGLAQGQGGMEWEEQQNGSTDNLRGVNLSMSGGR